jgi:hypothetical protein
MATSYRHRDVRQTYTPEGPDTVDRRAGSLSSEKRNDFLQVQAMERQKKSDSPEGKNDFLRQYNDLKQQMPYAISPDLPHWVNAFADLQDIKNRIQQNTHTYHPGTRVSDADKQRIKPDVHPFYQTEQGKYLLEVIREEEKAANTFHKSDTEKEYKEAAAFMEKSQKEYKKAEQKIIEKHGGRGAYEQLKMEAEQYSYSPEISVRKEEAAGLLSSIHKEISLSPERKQRTQAERKYNTVYTNYWKESADRKIYDAARKQKLEIETQLKKQAETELQQLRDNISTETKKYHQEFVQASQYENYYRQEAANAQESLFTSRSKRLKLEGTAKQWENTSKTAARRMETYQRIEQQLNASPFVYEFDPDR